MKRLLAYLFIVLGLGLTFSVSAEAKKVFCQNIENEKWAYISFNNSCKFEDYDFRKISRKKFLDIELSKEDIDDLNNIELHNILVSLYRLFERRNLDKKIINDFVNSNGRYKKYIPIISSIKKIETTKKKLDNKKNITIVDITFCTRNTGDRYFVISGAQGYLGNSACPRSHPIVMANKKAINLIDKQNICVKSPSKKNLNSSTQQIL